VDSWGMGKRTGNRRQPCPPRLSSNADETPAGAGLARFFTGIPAPSSALSQDS
jgi:hypothetical protein